MKIIDKLLITRCYPQSLFLDKTFSICLNNTLKELKRFSSFALRHLMGCTFDNGKNNTIISLNPSSMLVISKERSTKLHTNY